MMKYPDGCAASRLLKQRLLLAAPATALTLMFAAPAHGNGNAEHGAQAFRFCAACHSLIPDVHLSGPSLARVWGRKAGSLASFLRYSDALKRSGQVWNEKSLDAWLRDPQKMIPGNFMTFAGLQDDRVRTDLIAFLKTAADGTGAGPGRRHSMPNLKEVPASARVRSIRHCRDTYFVTNAAGESVPFWEYNLRFKTDTSANGPAAGQPVIVDQGMQGDRAQVVFATPGEISPFIRRECS